MRLVQFRLLFVVALVAVQRPVRALEIKTSPSSKSRSLARVPEQDAPWSRCRIDTGKMVYCTVTLEPKLTR